MERDLTPVSLFHASLAALERAELELREQRWQPAEETLLGAALALDRVGSPTATVRAVLALQRWVGLRHDRPALLAEIARVRHQAQRRV